MSSNFNVSGTKNLDFTEITQQDIALADAKLTLENAIKKKLDTEFRLDNIFNAIRNRIANKTNTQREKTLKNLLTALKKDKNYNPNDFNQNNLPKKIQTQYKYLKVLINNAWNNKNQNPIGKGGFGYVYESNDKRYVFKVMHNSKDLNNYKWELHANKKLFEGLNKQDDQAFFKEGQTFITQFCGAFTTEQGFLSVLLV